ncbi:tripartite tricarboxylate transporter substrate binding protein [Variovorax beijingensis]|uniref:Tripartite tricarboxylate transporter substrate binding protein n=2 Tax=Variovorax beijingensis TaxID=2496117 RepID=A0ABX9ZXB2_9BURK|nr:tripartite tricarboxylate transporter substrate binding protein [Variovorax beijingensis]
MLRLLVAIACLSSIVATAQTTAWPTHPIKVVVPAPAGGPYDRIMRPLAQKMATSLGQPLVIDNRPSAGNIVGTQFGASAAPDGYTLTMTGMLNTIAHGMYDKVPFDIAKDFEPVGAIGEGAQWLIVRSDSGIASLSDLLAKAKTAPGTVDYASSGAGSTGHLLMELLQRAAKVQLTHVPYKGGAPALQDVLAGVVAVMIIPPNAAQASVRSGKLRVIAVSSARRSPAWMDVPTFAELGYPDLTVSSWVGLSAPKGTPVAVVDKLNAALNEALNDKALLQQLDAEGLTPLRTTPKQYGDLVVKDLNRWSALVRSLGLRAN